MKFEKYETKPVEAVIVQWDGTGERALEIINWVGQTAGATPHPTSATLVVNGAVDTNGEVSSVMYDLQIKTPITLFVASGEYVVRDENGIFKVYTQPDFDAKFVKKTVKETTTEPAAETAVETTPAPDKPGKPS